MTGDTAMVSISSSTSITFIGHGLKKFVIIVLLDVGANSVTIPNESWRTVVEQFLLTVQRMSLLA